MTILITGASGFVGSFAVERALERGYEVWAGVRKSSSRRYLTDPRIHFAELDLGHPEVLCQQLRELKAGMGGRGWDYVVHAAGATKARRPEDFYKTNTEGTQNLIEGLKQEGMEPKRFIFISSLSVYGAIRDSISQRVNESTSQQVNESTSQRVNESTSQRVNESTSQRVNESTSPRVHESARPEGALAERSGARTSPWVYEPILLTDTPRPNTRYGDSKLKAERVLKEKATFPYVILRPTGVYGPRERDYMIMIKSIDQHVDFAVGYRPQEITFIYVEDLVEAILLSLTADGVEGKDYFLTDGEVYTSRTFSDLVRKELGNPWLLRIKAPIWLLKAICAVSGTVCGWLGRTTTLNLDKYHILRQRNWQCDVKPAYDELGYKPAWTLERGTKATVEWYKKNRMQI